MLTNEQNQDVKNQIASLQSGFMAKFTNKKLTTSTSLTPIKITIHDDCDLKIAKTLSNNQIDLMRQNNGCNNNKSNLSCDYAVVGEKKEDDLKQRKVSKNVDLRNTSSSVQSNMQTTKPGSEVLNLISLWIKNSPNDFLGKIYYQFVILFQNLFKYMYWYNLRKLNF